METLETFLKKTLELMGFKDYRMEIDAEHGRGLIFVYDNPTLIKENLPVLVEHMNHIVRLVARKFDQPPIFFDLNNYRRERENLIVELARAAAKKVIATGADISLPAMNAYERRIVHTTLSIHPMLQLRASARRRTATWW